MVSGLGYFKKILSLIFDVVFHPIAHLVVCMETIETKVRSFTPVPCASYA